AGDPVGLQVGLSQRLIDAGLERTERPAALQHQGDALERRPRNRAMAFSERLRDPPALIAGRTCQPGFELGRWRLGLAFKRGDAAYATRGHVASWSLTESFSRRLDGIAGL